MKSLVFVLIASSTLVGCGYQDTRATCEADNLHITVDVTETHVHLQSVKSATGEPVMNKSITVLSRKDVPAGELINLHNEQNPMLINPHERFVAEVNELGNIQNKLTCEFTGI